MKPNPFASLNHLTVPSAILLLLFVSALNTGFLIVVDPAKGTTTLLQVERSKLRKILN
jgi:hypothetical protein